MISKITVLFAIFLIASCVLHMQADGSNSTREKNSNLRWRFVEKFIKNTGKRFVRRHLGQFFRLYQKLNVSKHCTESLTRLIYDLQNFEGWTLQMIDATGKPPSGILGGTALDFGSFDGCLKIRVKQATGQEEEREAFRGKYCMVGYHSPLMMPISTKTKDGLSYTEAYGFPPDWIGEVLNKSGAFLARTAFWFGTCVPSTCSEGDIQHVATLLAGPYDFEVKTAGCYVDGPREWSTSGLIAVNILGFLTVLSALSTIVDVIIKSSVKNISLEQPYWSFFKILEAFSVYSNTEKLFDIPNKKDILGCFNGIRFFSAVWIILGHTYWFTDAWKYLKYRNALSLDDQFNYYLPAAVLENFSIPVGSFFFMSGFLLVFTTWNKMQSTGGALKTLLWWLEFIFHKYWRMTPALGLMIVMLLALPMIGSGPLWKSALRPPIEACEMRWWTNLFYINNFWNSEQYCLIHTWYLPALMQFHIIGAALLIIIFRWPNTGICIGVLLAIGGCMVTAFITIVNDFPMPTPAVSKDLDLMDEYNSLIYTKPYCHIPSYLIGMVVAHLVMKYKDIELRWVYQIVGWLVAISCALLSVYGLYGPAENILIRAFYISCYRIGWALGVGWLAFVCITGRGGVVNRILSWKAFVPLGQLSYLVYLVHPLIMLYRTASLKERIYYGHNELVFEFITYTVISFFLSFIGHVAVERPFLILEAIFLRSGTGTIKRDEVVAKQTGEETMEISKETGEISKSKEALPSKCC